MADLNRIKKELKDCQKDGEKNQAGLTVKVVDETNLMHWNATIKGPVGTPYENGVFTVDINLPSDYPFVPPKMKFITKVWHPNISSESGAICLDILKNEWSPALTVRTALISLQALLSAPEPDDPQDAVVAKQYKESRAEYESTAKFWTESYATEQSASQKIDSLMSMGFDRAAAEDALKKCDDDENRAIELLLSGA